MQKMLLGPAEASRIAKRARQDLRYGEELLNAMREKALSDFAYFVTHVLGYQLTPFHRRWFQHQVDHDRTILLAPRGHGKSTICDTAFVLWRLAQNRDLRILICSKTGPQAHRFLEEIKKHCESNPVFIMLFGDWTEGDEWGKQQIRVPRQLIAKEPSIFSIGISGSLPSLHFDMIVVDDPHDLWNSRTPGEREIVWNWYQSVMHPTLEPDGELHVIGTRWHPDDLFGRLIAVQEGHEDEEGNSHPAYELMKDKAIIDDEEEKVLWPERYTYQYVDQLRTELGPTIFSLQYQMEADVALSEGLIFNANQFLIATDDEVERLKSSALMTAVYWDLATGEVQAMGRRETFEELPKTNYTAKVGGFLTRDLRFVVETWWRGRPGLNEQVQRIKQDHREREWDEIGIEAVAYQSIVAKHLMATTAFPIRPQPRKLDKLRMAWSVQPYVATQRVILAQSCLGLRDMLVEFPRGEEDDSVDAFTGWMTMLSRRALAMELAGERCEQKAHGM